MWCLVLLLLVVACSPSTDPRRRASIAQRRWYGPATAAATALRCTASPAGHGWYGRRLDRPGTGFPAARGATTACLCHDFPDTSRAWCIRRPRDQVSAPPVLSGSPLLTPAGLCVLARAARDCPRRSAEPCPRWRGTTVSGVEAAESTSSEPEGVEVVSRVATSGLQGAAPHPRVTNNRGVDASSVCSPSQPPQFFSNFCWSPSFGLFVASPPRKSTLIRGRPRPDAASALTSGRGPSRRDPSPNQLTSSKNPSRSGEASIAVVWLAELVLLMTS